MDAALQHACTAYTPYYHLPAAAAVIFRPSPAAGAAELEIAAGPCMESAAHNPGMLPLQTAIAAAVLTGRMRDFGQVLRWAKTAS